MRCTDHSTPRTQFLELLVNSFINMDDPWAAVSQDDIVVFGSLWGTLLGPLGLYKCTWQHNSTSYSFHFHSDSTDVKQCCTCWVVFVVFLFLVLVVFSVFFFFFWNSATCFFAVMFQHSLLEGFSGLEVCCQDMYYMGLEVMNVKISLKKKKKLDFKPRWSSQARITPKKVWVTAHEQENIGDGTKPSLWAPCRQCLHATRCSESLSQHLNT